MVWPSRRPRDARRATLLLVTLLTLLSRSSATAPTWTQPQYDPIFMQEPQSTTNVGFDAAGKCTTTTGGTLVYNIENCPYAMTYKFKFVGSQLQVIDGYDADTLPTWLVDCRLHCYETVNEKATAYISLGFIDTNDHSPIWETAFPRILELRTFAPATMIVRVTANDADINHRTNGKVTYSLPTTSDNPEASKFVVGKSTGVIIVNRNALDWEPGVSKLVKVLAKDSPSSGTPNETPVWLNLTIANDTTTTTLAVTIVTGPAVQTVATNVVTALTTTTTAGTTTTVTDASGNVVTQATTAAAAGGPDTGQQLATETATTTSCSSIECEPLLWLGIFAGAGVLLICVVTILVCVCIQSSSDSGANKVGPRFQ